MITYVENSNLPMKNGSRSFHMPRGISGKLFLAITQLVLCLGIATVSQAATTTFNVNSFDDFALGSSVPCDSIGTCTLRAAIQAANAISNSTDAQGNVLPHTINLPAGTYYLDSTLNSTLPKTPSTIGINEDKAATGDLDIRGNVTIVGADRDTTIIDGFASDRVLQIMGGATVSISNVTIQNGYVDADTNNNVSSGGGGGIYNSGVLRIENCVIRNNHAVNGTGTGGGGLQTTGVAGTGPNTVKTVIVQSTISNNSAPLGGGVRNFFGSTLIDLTDVTNNAANQYSGGGVQNAGGSMSITRSTINNNLAQQTGGGVDNLDALDITQSSIYLNCASGSMDPSFPPQTVPTCIVPGAIFGGAGGGISNGSAGSLNMVNTTVGQNQAALAGGGIYNHKDATVTNSTIYDNSVSLTTGSGGTEIFACGSQNQNQDPTKNLTCSNGIKDANGKLLIHTNFINTIVGNSTTSDNCNGDTADLVISKGHNIETTTNTCGFTKSGDQMAVSPATLFSDVLKYHGGPGTGALFTLPISSSSPAYNAGDSVNCPATDERGFLRGSECDIGAYGANAVYSGNSNVLDLALNITKGVAAPLNGSVQVTSTFSVANKGPLQATNIVLTGSIPSLSGLSMGPLDSRCSKTSTGFICTAPTLDAYDSADFYVVLFATKVMNFDISGEVTSDQVDNYRPDNLKTVTIDIPTVAGSSVSGNNFAGSSGGGTMDWLSLMLLSPTLARRLRHRKRFG